MAFCLGRGLFFIMKERQSRFKPYKKKNRYYNSEREKQPGFAFDTLYMVLGSLLHRVRDAFRGAHQWGLHEKPIERSSSLAVTWIGHSTFLIQVGGINFLIDPLFGNASFIFQRLLPPGISLDDLPDIDCVLISHNHRDHMEKSALLRLKEKNSPLIFVPSGLGQWFDCRGFKQVNEFDWWEQREFTPVQDRPVVRCTFLPAQHWSQRALLDKNISLWGSWIIECNGYTIYFAGDTTYSGHFKAIAEEFPHIDLAILPIGPCEPNSVLKHSHMNAQEAGQAFCDLNASHFIPMHWGTFHFGVEPFDLPIKRLSGWWNEHDDELAGKQLHVCKVGQRIKFDNIL